MRAPPMAGPAAFIFCYAGYYALMNDYASTVLPIVRATREMLLPHYGCIEETRRKGEHPASAVTRLDLEVETYLREELAKKFADISFAGEEFGGSRDEARFWLCDPIDGTGHFLRGLPFCTVMLALIEDQKVNFSVVYDFVNDIVYHAARGKGAFANDTPIQVSKRPLADSYLIVEYNTTHEENRDTYLKLFKKGGLLEMITAGWSLAMVAAGKIDGRVTWDGWGFDYDFAPGSLLVEEAGGIVANVGSRSYDYRKLDFLACNKEVFAELTEGPDALFPTPQDP